MRIHKLLGAAFLLVGTVGVFLTFGAFTDIYKRRGPRIQVREADALRLEPLARPIKGDISRD